jgi:glutamyl-tRNA reductase
VTVRRQLEMTLVQEAIRYQQDPMVLDLASLIHELHATIDDIVETELKRFRSRLSTLSPDQKQAVRWVMRGIAHGILDPVIQNLKQAAEQGDSERVERICGLFDPVLLPIIQSQKEKSGSFALDQRELLTA